MRLSNNMINFDINYAAVQQTQCQGNLSNQLTNKNIFVQNTKKSFSAYPSALNFRAIHFGSGKTSNFSRVFIENLAANSRVQSYCDRYGFRHIGSLRTSSRIEEPLAILAKGKVKPVNALEYREHFLGEKTTPPNFELHVVNTRGKLVALQTGQVIKADCERSRMLFPEIYHRQDSPIRALCGDSKLNLASTFADELIRSRLYPDWAHTHVKPEDIISPGTIYREVGYRLHDLMYLISHKAGTDGRMIISASPDALGFHYGWGFEPATRNGKLLHSPIQGPTISSGGREFLYMCMPIHSSKKPIIEGRIASNIRLIPNSLLS